MTDGERLTSATADRRRVCSCVCPVAHGGRRGVCQQFIESGQPVMLERISDEFDAARCLPCTAAVRAAAARCRTAR